MIEHVYRRACEATSLSRVIVATDDLRVFEAVRAFGGEVLMTSPHHRTGSERVAEVAAQIGDDLIVNVQGDEPLLAPGMIDDAVAACVADPSLVMSTVRTRITDPAEIASPAVVKVVDRPAGPRALLHACRRAVPAGSGHAGDVVQARRPVRLPARLPARASRRCPRRRWNRANRSSNCARSSTGTRS